MQALESLPYQYAPFVADDIAKKCVIGLCLVNPTNFLVDILQVYADVIESNDIDIENKALLHPRFTSGKLTFKEFTKRVVYFLLEQNWPKIKRRAPNKETAIVVNIIVGLRGANTVTANDITQMNRKTRRRYYKETEEILAK